MRKIKKQKEEKQPFYIVLNKNGEVFVGLLGGQSVWSANWDEAKPLPYSNTKYLRQQNTGIELIDEKQF
jgi:hypothetical protein